MADAEQFNRTASGGAQAGLERLQAAQLQAEQLLDIARVSRSPSPAIVKRTGSTKSVMVSSLATTGYGGSSLATSSSSHAIGMTSGSRSASRGGAASSTAVGERSSSTMRSVGATSTTVISEGSAEGNQSEIEVMRARLTSHLSNRYSGLSSKSGSTAKVTIESSFQQCMKNFQNSINLSCFYLSSSRTFRSFSNSFLYWSF